MLDIQEYCQNSEYYAPYGVTCISHCAEYCPGDIYTSNEQQSYKRKYPVEDYCEEAPDVRVCVPGSCDSHRCKKHCDSSTNNNKCSKSCKNLTHHCKQNRKIVADDKINCNQHCCNLLKVTVIFRMFL